MSGAIKCPAIGSFDFQGAGTGSITFAMATDVSADDIASDGVVMRSKIIAENGTAAIEVQQTSPMHQWLTKLYNYLVAAPTREWASISLMATSPDMKTTHDCSFGSFQKRGDKPYQSQGQRVTWTLMFAHMTEIT